MHHGWNCGIVQWQAARAAIGKGAGDAYCAERIETVGILNHRPLDRPHRSRQPDPPVRHSGHNLSDMLDERGVRSLRCEPCTRGARCCIQVAISKLPIGHIMQQGGEIDDQPIDWSRLFLSDPASQAPHPRHMPPIMGGVGPGHLLANELLCPRNQVVIVHRGSRPGMHPAWQE
jgi:hypothetical protein